MPSTSNHLSGQFRRTWAFIGLDWKLPALIGCYNTVRRTSLSRRIRLIRILPVHTRSFFIRTGVDAGNRGREKLGRETPAFGRRGLRIRLYFRLRVMIGPRTDRVDYLKTKQYFPAFLYFATNGYGKDAIFNSDSLFLLWIFYRSRSTGLTYVKSAPVFIQIL